MQYQKTDAGGGQETRYWPYNRSTVYALLMYRVGEIMSTYDIIICTYIAAST